MPTQSKKTLPNNGANGNGARMAGEERRLQIVRVAMRLFSQRGFRGTTTKEIAVAAGVSEAMVFRHFATKEELYSAILDHKACLHDAVDPLQRVAEAIERRRTIDKIAIKDEWKKVGGDTLPDGTPTVPGASKRVDRKLVVK